MQIAVGPFDRGGDRVGAAAAWEVSSEKGMYELIKKIRSWMQGGKPGPNCGEAQAKNPAPTTLRSPSQTPVGNPDSISSNREYHFRWLAVRQAYLLAGCGVWWRAGKAVRGDRRQKAGCS